MITSSMWVLTELVSCVKEKLSYFRLSKSLDEKALLRNVEYFLPTAKYRLDSKVKKMKKKREKKATIKKDKTKD